MGSMTRFIRPFRGFHGLGARCCQQTEGRRKLSEMRMQRRPSCHSDPRNGTPEGNAGEAEKDDDFDGQHEKPREDERGQVLPFGHGRGNETF